LPLGDSITAGQAVNGGYRDPLFTSLANVGFTVRSVGTQNSYVTAALTAANNVPHEGHPGFTIAQILANLDVGSAYITGVPGTRDPVFPDVILLMLGTNDVGSQARSAAETLVAFDTLLTKLTTLRPSALIVAATLVPYTGATAGREQRQLDFNAGLPALIAAHRALGQRVTLCDMRPTVTAAGLSGDGVHPNQTGYNQIASVWFEAIKTLPLIENWRRIHFSTTTSSGLAADSADPDADGSSNLFEYAFGTDPNSAVSRFTPEVSIITDAGLNYLSVTFPRRRDTDIRTLVQTTADLAPTPTWTNDVVQIGAPIILDADFERVTVRDRLPLSTSSRRFIRVTVTPP
jgi:lysophospholipase L1-like esterase